MCTDFQCRGLDGQNLRRDDVCKQPMISHIPMALFLTGGAQERGFRVAVAFQLETYVVAFLTKDMLFHVCPSLSMPYFFMLI